jgi:hypothetical protein
MTTEDTNAGAVGSPVERPVRRPVPERAEPGPCGDPDCDDGYVFHPPLQEGARGCVTKCQRCADNWRRHWEARR